VSVPAQFLKTIFQLILRSYDYPQVQQARWKFTVCLFVFTGSYFIKPRTMFTI